MVLVVEDRGASLAPGTYVTNSVKSRGGTVCVPGPLGGQGAMLGLRHHALLVPLIDPLGAVLLAAQGVSGMNQEGETMACPSLAHCLT
jgi:hypothetical protein